MAPAPRRRRAPSAVVNPSPVPDTAAPAMPDLATVIRQIQSSFVRSDEPHRVFDALLPDLLRLCESEYGFIGEVWLDEAGAPFLKIFTMTNIAWDEASRAHVERERVRGIEFRNLNTLFGAALVSRAPVIANDAATDARRGGVPHGHTPLRSFMGVPLHYGGQMVGMIGVANRPGGYDQALIDRLDPLFQSMAGIAAAVQLDRQRRDAEARLRHSDERWRHLLELLGAGLAVIGADGRFLDVSPRLAEILCRSREELLQLSIEDITYPDDIEPNRALARQLVVGAIDHHLFEARYLRPDGQPVWIQYSATALRDERGRFEKSIAIVFDIDQRKRTETVLREREARFSKLASRMPGVLLQFHVDAAGHASVPYANAAMRTMFELDPDGPVRHDARLMMDCVVKGQRGRIWSTLEESRRTLKPWQMDWELDLPTLGRRWVEGRGTPERLADGGTLWHGYIDDITERKHYEEMVVAAQASSRANAAKTEFLSRMSHELRTPLNAVLGFAQLLAADGGRPLDELQRTRVAHIERAGQHLLAMIGDVLDLSRIEGGSLPLVLQPVGVRQLLDEAFALVATTAAAAGVRLLRSGAATPDASLRLRADPMRLRQVLVNLLSNAIKYNRRDGEVTVEVEVPPRAAGAAARVRIAVTDTGIGLSPLQQAHLFEPFNRLGAERSEIEGTGLGLAITRRLVELMAGAIAVRSEPGRGSTFVVDLPEAEPATGTQVAAAPAAIPVPAGSLAEMVVLYAEDNELNIELVRQLLSLRGGCALRVATSGREAIESARRAPPDLLLIDMHLGDMGGLDVLDALRSDATLRHVPRIALSADALPQSIERARHAGFDEYLTKPVDIEELLRCLHRHRPARMQRP